MKELVHYGYDMPQDVSKIDDCSDIEKEWQSYRELHDQGEMHAAVEVLKQIEQFPSFARLFRARTFILPIATDPTVGRVLSPMPKPDGCAKGLRSSSRNGSPVSAKGMPTSAGLFRMSKAPQMVHGLSKFPETLIMVVCGRMQPFRLIPPNGTGL